jgi:two-component system, chemotaxis family, sensor kinase CheA
MNEFVEQFLLESRDLIAQATDDLLALEEKPGDRDRLDGAFRAFHTLKGAAGIVDFAAMARTLHAAEDILATIRSSDGVIAPDVLNECLTCLDLTSRWLDSMEASGEAPTAAEAEADDMIVRLAASRDADEQDQVSLPGSDNWLERLRIDPGEHISGPRTALRYVPDQDAFFRGHDPMTVIAALPNLLRVDFALTDPSVSLESMNTFGCGLDIVALMGAPASDVRAALAGAGGMTDIRELASPNLAQTESVRSKAVSLLEAQLLVLQDGGSDGFPGRLASVGRTAVNALIYLGRSEAAVALEQAVATAQAGRSAAPLIEAIERAVATPRAEHPKDTAPTLIHAPRALRVDMSRIDALVKLTGELIVLKNAVGHAAKLSQENTDPAVLAASLREQHALFDRLATELQAAVLRIRVLPLRSVFRRFPKLVREIAGSVGKTVRLIAEGEDTEADASIVDALFEPLLHVLRNAIDHGIEKPERRAAAGKPAIGTVMLRARRDADNVVIDIEDDGGGIDVARVRAVAGERRIASVDTLAAMTEVEAANLIFAPGFSTAATVTDLSGRGVGMDSVKAAVERLGGRVVLLTRPGTGTTISLILPFSLMMTPVMTVEVAGQAFGLPLDAVLETTIVERNLVVPIGSGHAVVLRNRTVPLVDLADMLGISRGPSDRSHAKIVVMSIGTQIAGLEVDRLGERMDIMLKPMDGLLAGVKGIAGTTLLGDGRVLIVLNTEEVFN